MYRRCRKVQEVEGNEGTGGAEVGGDEDTGGAGDEGTGGSGR